MSDLSNFKDLLRKGMLLAAMWSISTVWFIPTVNLSFFIYTVDTPINNPRTHRQIPVKPTQKVSILYVFDTFFHVSSCTDANMSPNVMIMSPKGNEMFLNKFLILFWYQNHILLLYTTMLNKKSLKMR